VQKEDYISHGMYQIAKREECDWKLKQATEIRELLFQRDQTMNSEELIYSNDPSSDPEMSNIHDVDMESLNAASWALEESLAKNGEKRNADVQ
jgi:hypothetical protein